MDSIKRRLLYHLHIDITREYELAHKKNRAKQYIFLDLENIRIQGEKCLDIWCDGRIYPKYSIINSTPNFFSPSSILRYVGDGHKGLLGYCNVLSSYADTLCHVITILKAQNHRYILELQQKNDYII